MVDMSANYRFWIWSINVRNQIWDSKRPGYKDDKHNYSQTLYKKSFLHLIIFLMGTQLLITQLLAIFSSHVVSISLTVIQLTLDLCNLLLFRNCRLIYNQNLIQRGLNQKLRSKVWHKICVTPECFEGLKNLWVVLPPSLIGTSGWNFSLFNI